jgi:hypothetical protein
MKAGKQVSIWRSFRHLLIFQIKLALDALRDLALSPLSVVVFVLDALRRPSLEDSWYVKLMALGRRSDRMINLFDEFSDTPNYTVDEALSGFEEAVKPHWQELVQRRRQRDPVNDGGGEDST